MSDEVEQVLVHLGRKNVGGDSVSWQVVTGPSFWDFTQVVASTSPLSSQRFLEDALQNSGEGQVGGGEAGFAVGGLIKPFPFLHPGRGQR